MLENTEHGNMAFCGNSQIMRWPALDKDTLNTFSNGKLFIDGIQALISKNYISHQYLALLKTLTTPWTMSTSIKSPV